MVERDITCCERDKSHLEHDKRLPPRTRQTCLDRHFLLMLRVRRKMLRESYAMLRVTIENVAHNASAMLRVMLDTLRVLKRTLKKSIPNDGIPFSHLLKCSPTNILSEE